MVLAAHRQRQTCFTQVIHLIQQRGNNMRPALSCTFLRGGGGSHTLHEAYLMNLPTTTEHVTAKHVNGELPAERDWQTSAGEPELPCSTTGAHTHQEKNRYVGKLKS